ncbi:uncharacterized protein PD653_1432 [Nocardioides sp. PD653]|nr:uncharacterized protein PD653B2_3203 [Nocardioides sp. PD653-B2]GAW54025.1 uncharacterized protein PD653_1432 [Nocardioides sp. PD653]
MLWARALLLAFVACFLGVTGHVTADGLLPGPAWLVVLFVGSSALCAPLLARPASLRRIVVLLVGGQTLVHLVLTIAAGHRGDPSAATTRPVSSALPTVDGRRVGSLQDQYDAMIGSTQLQPALPVGHLVDDLAGHAPMMAAHLVAAVLVGVWLAIGERSLWTLVALASAALVRPLLLAWALVHVRPVAPRGDLVTVPAEPPGLRAPARIARCVVRRGPPALLAAA